MTKHSSISAAAIDSLPETWVNDRRGRPMAAAPRNDVAAIYARYSTDRQTFESVERKVTVCMDYIVHTGRTVYMKYADEARSGTTEVGREQLAAMLSAAEERKFGVLVIENVDRLARDLCIASQVFRRLAQLGVEMHQPGRGKLNVVDIAWQAVMGEEGRRVLIERTSFARENMARKGLFPTGRVYGYQRAPEGGGKLVKVEAQAKIVNRIYDLRLEGLNARNIAFCLNADSTADKTWTDHGIEHVLQNPLYNGVMVFKRHKVTRDPLTRRKVVTARPKEDWIVTKVPHLRIVDEEAWEAVQAMKAERRLKRAPAPSTPRKYLLSKKVKCPGCGYNMTVIHGSEKPYFECSDYKGKRVCKSRAKVRVSKLEEAVLEVIGEHLLSPGYAEAYAASYNEERSRLDHDHAAKRSVLMKRVEQAQLKLDLSADKAFMQGFSDEVMVAQRIRVQSEFDRAQAALAELPRAPVLVRLDEKRLTTLREAVQTLPAKLPFLTKDEPGLRLVATIRELVERVEWVPRGFSSFDLTVTLRVATVLATDHGSGLPQPVRLAGSYRWKGKGYVLSEEAKLNAVRLAEGAFRMTDAEWEAVMPLIPDVVLKVKDGKPLPGRTLVEAILFHMLSGAPWLQVPASFAPFKVLHSAARKLSYHGAWDLVRAELQSLDQVRYGALRENLFSDSATMRSRKLPKTRIR